MNIKIKDYIKRYDDVLEEINKLNHVLIVDDDEEILNLLSEFLSINHYAVSKAKNIPEAEKLLKQFEFKAVIMDVMLGENDGIKYMIQNRNNANDVNLLKMPIILLTALGDFDDRIYGLESGADDYLSKPFDPRELLLRLTKLISKYNIAQSLKLQQSIEFTQLDNSFLNKNNIVQFGEFSFHINTCNLYNGVDNIYLTNVESKLLYILVINACKILSRDEIIELFITLFKDEKNNINDAKNTINSRTIDTQIARLRNKFEINPRKPEFLQTVRGYGYILYTSSF